MADALSVSGSSNPYATQSFTAEANDRNTITMTGFFQLLATQLQNQDMTNPMDNSEIMNQMTQMAMVQSISSMTDAMKNMTTINSQTYAASLVGQEVTMAVTEENSYGQEVPVDVKYAKVEWVNFTSGNPTIKVEGDDKEYQLKHLVGMGRVPNPFEVEEEEDEDDGGDEDDLTVDESDKVTDTEGADDPDKDTDLENDVADPDADLI
ncbi:MAG: flagellar hook capping protein [Lachnospiraceae bacterium]|jgi:flagellar basal-body rod modification protein FlgD|nr:flagellar hook capping protein [Lachnospiraceae bacterium]